MIGLAGPDLEGYLLILQRQTELIHAGVGVVYNKEADSWGGRGGGQGHSMRTFAQLAIKAIENTLETCNH